MGAPDLIPTVDRYHPAARIMHWTVAVLLFVVFPFGAVIKFVKEDVKLTFYAIHENLGFLILWLMLARLTIRLLRPPPPEPPMPKVFTRAADVTHKALYAALILQPIFGFLATNAFGFPLNWFGLGVLWSPIGKDPELAPLLMSVHVALGWAILVLFTMHMGGVIFHHVLRRDPTLYRMI